MIYLALFNFVSYSLVAGFGYPNDVLGFPWWIAAMLASESLGYLLGRSDP